MVNLIGAYIFTLLLLGVAKERKQIIPLCEQLERLPLSARWALGLLMLWMLVIQGDLIRPESIPFLLVLPHFLFDGLNLWMHEAGHVYWQIFGQFILQLGGTLNEVLFPALAIAWCRKRHFGRAEGIGCFWLAFNLLDISRYMADAQERLLPLLGADASAHDWGNMLTTLGILPYDNLLAGLVYAAAWLCAFYSLWIFGQEAGGFK
jgi:hypothetical protein